MMESCFQKEEKGGIGKKKMRYSKERKEAVLKKMMPPHNRPLAELSREEGISVGTLYNWRHEARREGRLMPAADLSPEGWSSKDKFAAVLETAAMNEHQLSEYCREKGLFPEQIATWREACEEANNWQAAQDKKLKASMKEQRKQNKQLQKELERKEKALAEAAALLVLKKKVDTLWGEQEDE